MEATKAARAALLATVLLAVPVLLIQGWRDKYSAALVIGIACLAFAFCAVVRGVLDDRSSELRNPRFVIASALVMIMAYLVGRLYLPEMEIATIFAPVVIFYGGLLGFGTSSVEYLIDYTVLNLLSIVFSAVTGLNPINSVAPWILIGAGLGALLTLRGPSFAVDVGLLGPFAFATFEYAIPVDSSKVPLLPISIAIGILAATSLLFRLVRWSQWVKAALVVLGSTVVVLLFPPW